MAIDLLRVSPFENLILQGLLDANKCRAVFYTLPSKIGFYCATFEKWIANLWGFAIINDVFEVNRACIYINLKHI